MKLIYTVADLKKALQYYLDSQFVGVAPTITDVECTSNDYALNLTITTEAKSDQAKK